MEEGYERRLLTAADAAREDALEELEGLLRHELRTVAHLGQAALDSCDQGDLAGTTRRLGRSLERLDAVLRRLERYRDASCTLGQVIHVVATRLARRIGAPLPIEVELEPGALDVELALPASALTLTLIELGVRLLGPDRALVVKLGPAETDEAEHRVVTLCGQPPGPPESDWRTDWVRETLRRHGAELLPPDDDQSFRFRVRAELVAT